MRTRLIGLVTVISGLMAMGALAWAYHSRSNLDLMKIGDTALVAKDGKLAIQHPTLAYSGGAWLQWHTVPYDMANDPMPVELRPPMFASYRSMELKNGWQRTVIFPLWLAAMVFCILPAVWAKRRLWRKSAQSMEERGGELASAVK